MRAFIVKDDTEVIGIKDGKEWTGNNFFHTRTTKEHMFFVENIRIDPLGNVGCGPQDSSTVGGRFASNGYYGFQCKNFCMLVPMTAVEVY